MVVDKKGRIKIKKTVATKPIWAALQPHERIIQHLGYNALVQSHAAHAAAAAAPAAGKTAAAPTTPEDPSRAQDRGSCGFILTDTYAKFSLDTDADVTAAIDWTTIGDAEARLDRVNNHGQNLADTHYPEDDLKWQGAVLADMKTNGTTHGQLADYFAGCYK